MHTTFAFSAPGIHSALYLSRQNSIAVHELLDAILAHCHVGRRCVCKLVPLVTVLIDDIVSRHMVHGLAAGSHQMLHCAPVCNVCLHTACIELAYSLHTSCIQLALSLHLVCIQPAFSLHMHLHLVCIYARKDPVVIWPFCLHLSCIVAI